MPVYTFFCEKCDREVEDLVDLAHRDDPRACPECGGMLVRRMDAPKLGSAEFQMQAILGGGKKVSGHFGKMAKMNGGKK